MYSLLLTTQYNVVYYMLLLSLSSLSLSSALYNIFNNIFNRDKKTKFVNILFSSLRKLNMLQIKHLHFNCKNYQIEYKIYKREIINLKKKIIYKFEKKKKGTQMKNGRT
jgi:hypothetical protein